MTFTKRCERLKEKGKHFRGVKTYYKTFEKFLKTALLKMVETVSESALSLCKSVPPQKNRVDRSSSRFLRGEGRGGCTQAKLECLEQILFGSRRKTSNTFL